MQMREWVMVTVSVRASRIYAEASNLLKSHLIAGWKLDS